MLQDLDTGDLEMYPAFRVSWIRDTEALVLVYSISRRSSFARILRYYDLIQQVRQSSCPIPLILARNKGDRVSDREESTQEGQALALKLGCEFVETSAKDCINVEKAFYLFTLVRLSGGRFHIRDREFDRAPKAVPAGSIDDIPAL